MAHRRPTPRIIKASAIAVLVLSVGVVATRVSATGHLPVAAIRIVESEPLVATDGLRIHAVRLSVSNAYLIETEAGVTLVDAGLPNAEGAIERRLEAIGRAGELCQIFLTHAHVDHVGAAAPLKRAADAPVIVHEADAEALALGETRLGAVRDWEWTRQPLPRIQRMARIRAVEPDRTVQDGDLLISCGLTARVVHVPGHTPGSSALLVTDPTTGATYAFAGDLISTTGGPHVQTSYAQDWKQVASSLAKLQAFAPDVVFPGHGRMALRADEFAALKLTGPAARAARP